MAIAVRSAQTTRLGPLAAGSGVFRSSRSAIEEHRVSWGACAGGRFDETSSEELRAHSSRFAMAALTLGDRGGRARRLNLCRTALRRVLSVIGQESPRDVEHRPPRLGHQDSRTTDATPRVNSLAGCVLRTA